MFSVILVVILLSIVCLSESVEIARLPSVFRSKFLRKSTTARELQQLLNQDLTAEAEDKFLSDLGLLREEYYDRFVYSCSKLRPEQLRRYQTKTISGCRRAMKAILPTNAPSHWTVEDSVDGLSTDIAQYIEENVLKIDEPKKYSLTQELQLGATGQRFRWLFYQSVLLLINIAQNELKQYWARRVVDRRLAEVPEFPLL